MKKLSVTTVLLLFAACMISAAPLQEGVSRALAQQRSSMLSNVRYTLSFIVPQDKQSDVCGRSSVSFSYNGHDDLQFDFCGKSQKLVSVNGRKAMVKWLDGHIIIPKSLLRKGTNTVVLDFVSQAKSLNRGTDYLYTLFVPNHACSVFPCFDQPDIKAHFMLSLTLPKTWKAISTGAIEKTENLSGTVKRLTFAATEPLPTYLFAFVAGNFQEATAQRDGRTMRALYRETDSAKVAQLPKIFDMAAFSLRWLENYTGIRCPFRNYGFVVLPGYQFGGMEHPGAIQFNDRTIFLGPNPTPDEELKRFELIAHETTHLWFGDLVTMRWFNDVWTKEVFANFMAAKMSRQKFSEINHDLNFLKMYQTGALATDRTDGTHPIQQPLDNLNQASLLYGNIIYDKAPVMMRKLEALMGEKSFQQGLQRYLKSYAYANATWDDLIAIFRQSAPDIQNFSDVWVKQKGMPVIETQCTGNKLIITQKDPFGRGLCWKQKFNVLLMPRTADTTSSRNKTENARLIQVDMAQPSMNISLDGLTTSDTSGHPTYYIYPNADGSGYGRFILPENSIKSMEASWPQFPELNRYAFISTLYENYLMHRIPTEDFLFSLCKGLEQEQNALVASACCNYMSRALFYAPDSVKNLFEKRLLGMSRSHKVTSVRQRLLRYLSTSASDSEVLDSIYALWSTKSDTLLNERDYMAMAYHLAIMRPTQWQSIISTQRARLSGADRIREFDFVSRACTPDTAQQQTLFRSLLLKENRAVEPWAAQLLALLNDASREPQSNGYILPSLNVLAEIQRTGDIFFPADWLWSLFSGHKSEEARQIVRTFITAHPDYLPPLMNKLKENAFYLLNN